MVEILAKVGEKVAKPRRMTVASALTSTEPLTKVN